MGIKYRISSHSSLDGYRDWVRSGGVPGHRAEALVRKAEKRRHKAFNAYARERGYRRVKGGFLPVQKPRGACPVCGRERRAGYYTACPDCMPVLAYRERLRHLVDQLDERLRQERGSVRVYFTGHTARVSVECRVACVTREAWDSQGESRVMAAGAERAFSLRELMAMDDKAAVHMVAQDVLRCWEAALQKAHGLAIDANGNQVTIAGVPVPCAGNWRQP